MPVVGPANRIRLFALALIMGCRPAHSFLFFNHQCRSCKIKPLAMNTRNPASVNQFSSGSRLAVVFGRIIMSQCFSPVSSAATKSHRRRSSTQNQYLQNPPWSYRPPVPVVRSASVAKWQHHYWVCRVSVSHTTSSVECDNRAASVFGKNRRQAEI